MKYTRLSSGQTHFVRRTNSICQADKLASSGGQSSPAAAAFRSRCAKSPQSPWRLPDARGYKNRSVTNTGDEVVQLYVRRPGATVPWPSKELKGFKRIHLEPGECKTVTFTLRSYQLDYYDEAIQYAVQPDVVEVLVGSSSRDLPLAGRFEIVGQRTKVDKVFFSHVSVK